MTGLFPELPAPSQIRDKSFDQYLTPEWAALALVEEFFPDLGENDLVIEPSCGRGAFLKAIPDHVRAIGVEIDAGLAQEAIENSGRPVIVGDFRTVDLPQATAVIGNPPFNLKLIEAFLARAHELLPDRGRCGLLLPSYAIQTPSRVLGWAKRWSLQNAVIPRTLFPRMIRPLVFIQFTKGEPKLMSGFSLYREADEITKLAPGAKFLLIHGKPRMSCWRAVVEWALRKLGGRAQLRDIYATVEPRRPSDVNRFWEAKVRQTLQRYFTSVERGVWAL
jgi:site-specific DNA-methyltransferase (adenine-specific)